MDVKNDGHVNQKWVGRCIKNGEYMVAQIDGKSVGFLRFSWFWGKIPYLDMIMVLESYRRSGVGTGLFTHWCNKMAGAGAEALMTSAMSDEPEPQTWHRRNGFVPTGSLTFGSLQQTPEIFFIKSL